jgi:hypothetical protein
MRVVMMAYMEKAQTHKDNIFIIRMIKNLKV